jgi:hypothetical protein
VFGCQGSVLLFCFLVLFVWVTGLPCAIVVIVEISVRNVPTRSCGRYFVWVCFCRVCPVLSLLYPLGYNSLLLLNFFLKKTFRERNWQRQRVRGSDCSARVAQVAQRGPMNFLLIRVCPHIGVSTPVDLTRVLLRIISSSRCLAKEIHARAFRSS